MEERYCIPLEYKEGVYGINELTEDNEKALELSYSDYGDIVTYELPDSDYGDEIRLYGIPKNILDTTLQATYDAEGQLKMLTINREKKEQLLYIHYQDVAQAQKEIECFAQENARCILDKIGMYKDAVSRLFVEYFNDGEYMDFHAKVGTEAEKAALEKKYPEDADIGNSCGDYSSKLLYGDNDRLQILVSCADNEEFDYFQHAVEIMTQLIEKEAPKLLNTAQDFQFMCMEYD